LFDHYFPFPLVAAFLVSTGLVSFLASTFLGASFLGLVASFLASFLGFSSTTGALAAAFFLLYSATNF